MLEAVEVAVTVRTVEVAKVEVPIAKLVFALSIAKRVAESRTFVEE